MADWFTDNAPASSAAPQGDWFAQNAPQPEQTPSQKFWNTLKSGNVATMFSHPLTSLGGMATGLFHEPSRILGELDAARNAKTGDEAWEHVKRAVPVLGPQWNQIQHDIDNGGYAEATAHFIDMMAPFIGPDLAAKYAPPVIRNVGPATKAAGTFVKEAAPGLAKTAVLTAPAAVLHHYLPAPLATTLGLPTSAAASLQLLKTLREAGAAAGETFRTAKAPEVPPAAVPAAPAPEPSEAYYAEQSGGRNALGPTSEEYYASQQTPAEPAATAPDLDDIARGLTGKPFAKLDANAQTIVRGVAEKLQRNAAPPEAAPPTPAPAPAPAVAPAPQPEYQPSVPEGATVADLIQQELAARRAAAAQAPVPPETPAAGPQGPASAPEGTPAAPIRQQTVAELSDALNKALAEEPGPKRDFAAEARAKRAADTPPWADYLQSKGRTAGDVSKWQHREQWRLQTQDRPEGLELPTPKGAAAIVKELQAREAAAAPAPNIPPVRPYPPPEGFFSPSAIQKLIDLQESGRVARPR